MQISTRVVSSTQIILNQDDISAAIDAFVRAQASISDDAKVDIDFKGALEASSEISVEVISESLEGAVGNQVRERGKPAPGSGRTRRTKEEIAEDEEAEKAERAGNEPTPEPVAETKPNISATPEDRQDPAVEEPAAEVVETKADEPPFEPDNAVEETEPKPTTGLSIFTSTKTSAPPAPVAEEPTPEVKAKSLFANLTKPN